MARHVSRPNHTYIAPLSTRTEASSCDSLGLSARRRVYPHRKIYPCLLSEIEKEMLIRLAEASGTTMCATIRSLIRRECAASGVV